MLSVTVLPFLVNAKGSFPDTPSPRGHGLRPPFRLCAYLTAPWPVAVQCCFHDRALLSYILISVGESPSAELLFFITLTIPSLIYCSTSALKSFCAVSRTLEIKWNLH